MTFHWQEALILIGIVVSMNNAHEAYYHTLKARYALALGWLLLTCVLAVLLTARLAVI